MRGELVPIEDITLICHITLMTSISLHKASWIGSESGGGQKLGGQCCLPGGAGLLSCTAIQGLWQEGRSLHHGTGAGDLKQICFGSQGESVGLSSQESHILVVTS